MLSNFICVVILGLFLDKISAGGLWICKDRKHGELLPHPENCHAYFVCDRSLPTLVVCKGELHFDPKQKVCNWPEVANCKLGQYPPYWNSSPLPTISTSYTSNPTEPSTPKTTEKTTTELTTKSTTTATTEIQTEPSTTKSTTKEPTTETTTTTSTTIPTTTTIKETSTIPSTIPTTVTTSTTDGCNTSPDYPKTTPKPTPKNDTIGSKDDDGKYVDPMKNYDPKKVQCLYNGLYFLPHPVSCEKYFICANHILYLHKCGPGIHWNYKLEQCDAINYSRCYSVEVEGITTTKRTTKRTTSVPKTQQTTTSTRKPTTTTPRPTSKSTTTTTTAGTTRNAETPEIVTTEANPTTPEDELPKCPPNKQIFVAHPKDCTKYYICIAGQAVLTTCPEKFWWDERLEWCGYPEFAYCRAAEKEKMDSARKKRQ